MAKLARQVATSRTGGEQAALLPAHRDPAPAIAFQMHILGVGVVLLRSVEPRQLIDASRLHVAAEAAQLLRGQLALPEAGIVAPQRHRAGAVLHADQERALLAQHAERLL